MYAHVLHHAVEGVEPAHRADVERAVLIYMADHKAYIVKMRGNDQRVALASEIRDNAPLAGHDVGKAEFVEHALQKKLAFLILSGGAVRL